MTTEPSATKGRRATGSRPAAPTGATTSLRSIASGGVPFWVLIQGTEITVKQNAERPASTSEPGEPMIELHGPFQSEENANSLAERLRFAALPRAERLAAHKAGK